MKDYRGYIIEIDRDVPTGYFFYHIKKDGEYVNTYLTSERACKCYISKLIKKGE